MSRLPQVRPRCPFVFMSVGMSGKSQSSSYHLYGDLTQSTVQFSVGQMLFPVTEGVHLLDSLANVSQCFAV